MGLGIAHALATAGVATVVVEPDRAQADSVRPAVDVVLADGVDRGRISAEDATAALARVSVVPSVDDLEDGLDLIVESVPESEPLKRSVLAAAEAPRAARDQHQLVVRDRPRRRARPPGPLLRDALLQPRVVAAPRRGRQGSGDE